jgi:hypothetical protein
MTSIEDARRIAVEFLQKSLGVKDVKVIGATKIGDGWDVEAEVYEESSFMKSLGLPSRIQDRNSYTVKLNDGMEVESYERQGHAAAAR